MGHLLRVIGSLGICPLSFVIWSFVLCHLVLCPLSLGPLLRVIWVIKNCHCEEPATGF